MIRTLTAAALLLAAAPAVAQQPDEGLPAPDAAGAGFTVGGGIAATPDYEGSDHYRLIPAAFARGKIGDNISFTTRGLALYVDLLSAGSGIDFDVGPIAGVRLNRTGKIADDFVDALPERDIAVELGGFAGVSFKGLTNPYDSLGLRVDVIHDVAGAHGSTIISPGIDFSTPLSQTFFIGASASADFVANDYADYYFTITPEDSLASALPAYDADGGIKNWKLGLLANASLSGDLRRGWSVFSTVNYSRLVGDFRDSPIVDLRGDPSQWFTAVGLAYSWN